MMVVVVVVDLPLLLLLLLLLGGSENRKRGGIVCFKEGLSEVTSRFGSEQERAKDLAPCDVDQTVEDLSSSDGFRQHFS